MQGYGRGRRSQRPIGGFISECIRADKTAARGGIGERAIGT